MTQTPDRLRPQPRANPDIATRAIRLLAAKSHPSVYFESIDAFEQSELGKSQNWSIFGVVRGRETTIQISQKGSKRGAGSAVIYRSETGNYVVLPNDGNKREAEHMMTVDGARKLFNEDGKMMGQIRNALRTNIEHRKDKMRPKKTITVYQRPH